MAKAKPGFYVEVERDEKNKDLVTIRQKRVTKDGGEASNSMRLMPMEAYYLNIMLSKHLVRKTKRSAYIGEERK